MTPIIFSDELIIIFFYHHSKVLISTVPYRYVVQYWNFEEICDRLYGTSTVRTYIFMSDAQFNILCAVQIDRPKSQFQTWMIFIIASIYPKF